MMRASGGREAQSEGTKPERLAELARESTALARVVARNPSASTELLSDLGAHSDHGVRRAVARNPSTPAELAVRLGSQFPSDLLDNPAFDFYLIEQPNLLDGVGRGALRSLLKRDRCPASFFAYAAGLTIKDQRTWKEVADRTTQLAVLNNASAPRAVVKKLMDSEHADVCEAASMHIAVAGDDPVESWATTFDTQLRQALDSGRAPVRSQEALAHLILASSTDERGIPKLNAAERRLVNAARPDWPARIRALFSEGMQEAVRTELLDDLLQHKSARLVLASHGKTPPGVLARLARDESSLVCAVVQSLAKERLPERGAEVDLGETPDFAGLGDLAVTMRRRLAKSAGSDPRLLAALTQDPEAEVAAWAIDNARTPASQVAAITEVLLTEIKERRLRDLNDPRVQALAANPSAPSAVLHQLAELASGQGILWRLFVNPNTTDNDAILVLGSFQPDAPSWRYTTVAKRIAKLPIADLLNNATASCRRAAAMHPEARSAELRQLSRADSVAVRVAVAANRMADASILSELASDVDERVRIAVSGNSKAGPLVQRKLANDEELDVRLALAKRKRIDASVLRSLAEDQDPNVRRVVADHLDANSEVIDLLARDEESWVRSSVARRSDLDEPTVELLANDNDDFVRADLAENSSVSSQMLEGIYLKELRRLVGIRLARELNFTDVFVKLASNKSTPTQVLADIARRKYLHNQGWIFRSMGLYEIDALHAVALNPSTPDALRLRVVDRLTASEDDDDQACARVCRQRYGNTLGLGSGELSEPALPPRQAFAVRARPHDAEAVEVALEQASTEGDETPLKELRAELIRRATAQSASPSARLLALMLPDAPPASLARAQRSSSWLDRCAVAMHPNTPPSAVHSLTNDGNSVVRSAARAMLADRPTAAA